MKFTTFSLLIALALGLGIWFARPTSDTVTATSTPGSSSAVSAALTTDAASFDFGRISMANGKVSREFKIQNPGTEPVKLTKLFTSCMCTEATLLIGGKVRGPFGMPGHGLFSGFSESVKPGEEAVVRATFDPNAHGPAGIGPIERVIYLENDAGAPLEFVITGSVTP